MQTPTLEEALKVFNWFYALGEPLISDVKYQQYYNQLREQNPESEVITKTWSEMEKPVEELKKVGLLEKANEIERRLKETTDSRFFLPEKNMELRMKYYQETLEYFERYIPKSIDSIEDINQSMEWFRTVKGSNDKVKINLSLKADGFNVANLYYNGYYIGSHTRGRSGTSLDVSIAMSKVVPMYIPVEETFLRITCEAVMNKDVLPTLREKDPSRDWKSPRNSIRTLLMNNIGEDYNKLIIPLAFKVEGKHFNSQTERFLWLESVGFKVVDNETFEFESNEDLINAIKEMGKMEVIYANDGVIVQLDDTNLYNQFDTSGKYDYAIRAYRLFNWQSSLYASLVTGVEPSYNTKRISLKVNIIPTTVSNGSTIRNLDVDNLARLQDSKVTKGSVVIFHMRSDSCVDWMDKESMIVNESLKHGTKLPEYLVQPVVELEYRLKRFRESGYDVTMFI